MDFVDELDRRDEEIFLALCYIYLPDIRNTVRGSPPVRNHHFGSDHAPRTQMTISINPTGTHEIIFDCLRASRFAFELVGTVDHWRAPDYQPGGLTIRDLSFEYRPDLSKLLYDKDLDHALDDVSWEDTRSDSEAVINARLDVVKTSYQKANAEALAWLDEINNSEIIARVAA